MLRTIYALFTSLTLSVSLLAAADAPPSRGGLTAAQIVDKNVAARGGLQAWRAVHSMSLTGKLGAGGNRRATLAVPGEAATEKEAEKLVPQRPAEEARLPFRMDLERPRKMRFELQFRGQTAIQVYDGVNGWKLRPFLNRLEVEAYTTDEMKIASTQADLDGPLVDYAAKGTRVDLDGMEKVEGRDTYKLNLMTKDGRALHVWIDAQTFLETKIEGQPRRLDGTEHPVEVYFREYRAVDGLEIPFVLETKVLPIAKTALGFRDTPVPVERITIEKVEINPKLEESRFSKPVVGAATGARSMATPGRS